VHDMRQGFGLPRGAIRIAAAFVLGTIVTGASAGELRVPYVPTPQEVVDRMLEVAKVTSRDYVIDLGSGDGRIVITAARKFGARGFGVDLNPDRIAEANENAVRAGVTGRVTFHLGDLFEADLSEATVITMYLLPQVNLELRPRLLDLRPGTRVVSHDFSMGDWEPDEHLKVEAKDKFGGAGGTSDVYLWIVPANVAGTWQWQLPVAGRNHAYRVTLTQKYQTISGSVNVSGRSVPVQNPRVNGDDISFAFTAELNGARVRHYFRGRVDGGDIVGTARLTGGRLHAQLEWSAQRAAKAAAVQPVPQVLVDAFR
jgi:hypothetical protein